ncbi:unnamed protein product, partial [Staurois parvus]
HLGDISVTVLTFWGDICTVLTFGGYLYRPDIWGISVPS